MTQETPERPRAYYDEFTGDGRRFRLVRDEDETGISGTGVVAVGIEFPSGTVVFEWRNDRDEGPETNTNGLSIKPGDEGMEDLIAVHGHGGRTRVEYVDPPRSVREGDAVECSGCGGVVPLDEWTTYRHGGGSCPLCGRDGLPDAVRRYVEDT